MKLAFAGPLAGALTVCLTLAGCGGAEPSAHTVSGFVSAETAVSSVSLKDSSVPTQERTSQVDADGAFSFQVSGLTQHYSITKFDDDATESRAFRAMLKEVSFTTAAGALTVTNRATGGVIYSASLSDVASGVLHPENIPGGTVTPPPPPPPTACT